MPRAHDDGADGDRDDLQRQWRTISADGVGDGAGNGCEGDWVDALTARASDNVGVAGVQFRLDGANLGAEDTAAPYSVTWDSTSARERLAHADGGGAAMPRATRPLRRRPWRTPTHGGGQSGADGVGDGSGGGCECEWVGVARGDGVGQCRCGRCPVPCRRRQRGSPGHTVSPYGVTWDSTALANGSALGDGGAP